MQFPSHPRRLLVLEFLLYVLLAAFALHATWLTWPDDLIDFSRELYLPWRVSCGDVLYRDLAYDFGPLSVYLNAALFALLGRPSIHALFALNFAFWLAILLALRALLRRLARPSVAAVCVSLFILLFSFNRYVRHPLGNLNYLAPYSHELPRGFLLALLSLLALDTSLRRRSSPLFFLSGTLLGLVLFTKPEIAIAAVSSSVILLFSHFLRKRGRPARDDGWEGKHPVRLFSLFTLHFSLHVGGVLCAVGMVLLPLSSSLGSFAQALRHGLLNLYLDCFNPALAAHPFYRLTTGLDAPLSHALRLLLGAVFATFPFFLARFALPRLPSRPFRLAATVLLALAAAALGWFAFFPLNAALPLAPVLFAMAILREMGDAASCRVLPERGRPARDGDSGAPPPPEIRNPTPEIRPCRPLALAFAAFSLALVSKIALNCGIGHYGFVLALPAFCCAVLLFFRPPCPAPRAAVAAALLLGFSAAALRQAHLVLPSLSAPIHDGAYLARPVEARISGIALNWLRANTAPDSTLAVLPEGAILNVLSGRPNPTPYVYLDHPALLRFGEPAVLAAYSNALPDTLVLVDIRASSKFGVDYAQSLMSFLDPLYSPALTLTFPSPDGPLPALVIATRSPAP